MEQSRVPSSNTSTVPNDAAEELARTLRDRIRRSGRISQRMDTRIRLTRAFLALNIFATPLATGYESYLLLQSVSLAWVGPGMFLALIAWRLQWAIVRHFRSPAGARVLAQSRLQPLPPQNDRAGIWQRLTVLTSRMGLDVRRFDVQISTRNPSFGPSIVERNAHQVRRNILLVIPVGWLPLNRTQPQLANAMLAHELGHVLNQDSRRWLEAIAYRKVAPLIIAAVFCLMSVNLYFSVVAFRNGIRELVTIGPGVIIWIFFYPLVVGSHTRLIRRSLRYSEETADCCAAVYVGESAIRNVLQFCQRNSRRNDLTDDHPSLEWRLKRLEERYRPHPFPWNRVTAIVLVVSAIAGFLFVLFRFSPYSVEETCGPLFLLTCLLIAGIAWSLEASKSKR